MEVAVAVEVSAVGVAPQWARGYEFARGWLQFGPGQLQIWTQTGSPASTLQGL